MNVTRMVGMAVAVMLLAMAGAAQADVFNMGPGLTSLETVPVGNPGNPGQLSGEGAGGYGPDRVCGSVSYAYNIGKYEVTAGQYTAFLNAVAKTDTYGLYNTGMWSDTYGGCKIERTNSPGSYTYSVASDWANRPVNYVSFGDSMRFANWLHNGQPTGAQTASTTEDGAYFVNGATSNTRLQAVTRKTGWTWAVTSEDEWYKAAYYDPNKVGGAGYWLYPTRSNDMPSNDLTDPDGGNNANFYQDDGFTDGFTIGSPYYRTEVGEFENSESGYNTFDQGGNVYEWNEAVITDNGSYRGMRGGSFGGDDYDLQSSYRYGSFPSVENYGIGFRVSQVPEPATLSLLALGGLAMLRRRKP